jgi:acetolactate synthase-1/2/3 large subunit
MKQNITGGEAMVLAAKANGIDRVFGIPGGQIYPLFDALKLHNIETITTRHEQGAAYMAMGAAKSTGKPAAYSVVPGPGVLNTTAALCTAMGTSSKVLCLTGQVPTTYLGKGRGHLHELKDQQGTLRSLIKDALHVTSPQDTSKVMNQAFNTMNSGRPGPVSVEMCWDTMARQSEIDILEAEHKVDTPLIDFDQIKLAAIAISKAKKPMIMCGGGALDSSEEIRVLAEIINCPVTSFRSGRGIVSDDHPLGTNSVAARLLWDDCDLLIGIGSRLDMMSMRWVDFFGEYKNTLEGDRTLIRIDIDPEEMERFIPDIPVLADATEACKLLISELEHIAFRNKDRLDEVAEAKAKASSLFLKIQPQVDYLKIIRDVLPRDGFFVPELSQIGFASYYGFSVYEPRSYVSEGFQGTLGYGFQTALGVKVANPKKAVVSVTGDGGFMFGVQELATAVAHNIGLITLLFNNNAYGNVRRDQINHFSGPMSSDLVNPDFVKLAESFGVASIRVNNPTDFKRELIKAIDADKPALIEITVPKGSESNPWEFIHMNNRPDISL